MEAGSGQDNMTFTWMTEATETSGTGWDEKASEYALLPENNRIFRLTKELLYHIIENDLFPDHDNKAIDVLDFNCGGGNDFPFFLDKGWDVTGCDGSAGMLNVALDRFKDQVEEERLQLFLGRSEDLDENSFRGRKFDLIFSTTGGFSYVDDHEFTREHQVLLNMLKPGGKLITAHLTPFCLPETLYEILHLRFGKAARRWKGNLQVTVKNEPYDMFLRSTGKLDRLLGKCGRIEGKYPVLAFTPPYQTGYNPPLPVINMHKRMEKLLLRFRPAGWIADQVAYVLAKA